MIRAAGLFLVCFLLVHFKLNAQDTTAVPASPDEQLAVQYYQAGEYDKAVIYYEKLYNKNPIAIYYNYYLNCLIYTKNFKKAEKTVKKQQSNNKWDLRYHIDFGRVYRADGNEDKAKKEFNENISTDHKKIIKDFFYGKLKYQYRFVSQSLFLFGNLKINFIIENWQET
jgi:tetratricopeptide (TPR) repeat protein